MPAKRLTSSLEPGAEPCRAPVRGDILQTARAGEPSRSRAYVPLSTDYEDTA